jgi:BED zinc finger
MVSFVWKYFDKVPFSDTVKCQVNGCGKAISRRGNSTTGMIKHLDGIHDIRVQKVRDPKQEW